MQRLLLLTFAAACLSAPAFAAKDLQIFFVDVEGGQATLIVSPSGQSMLVDAGWPGYNGRDADRIKAAAKAAGVKKIDYFVATHYHRDHIGGVPQVFERLPILNFVDHGPSFESGKEPDALFQTYAEVRAKGKHISVKPGDKLPMKGVDVEVLTASGERIGQPRAGAGQPNPLCAAAQQKAEDKTENGRSVGLILTLGKFRFINLGDLTWNKELELVCPNNTIGTVDVYLTTHHGMNMSGPEQIVHALRPRVAVMNNGAKKGGTAEAMQAIKKSPGLEDFWQLHYSVAAKDLNSSDPFIANTDEACTGHWLKLTARPDGSFTLTNGRNKYEKTYPPRS